MSSQFGKVAVLLGGTSAEREISLMSGRAVLAALQGAGVDAHAFDPAETDLHILKEQGYERAFIALHGRGGEDGTVQGMMDLMGLRYTHSGLATSVIAIDKQLTKLMLREHGIRTINGNQDLELEYRGIIAENDRSRVHEATSRREDHRRGLWQRAGF